MTALQVVPAMTVSRDGNFHYDEGKSNSTEISPDFFHFCRPTNNNNE